MAASLMKVCFLTLWLLLFVSMVLADGDSPDTPDDNSDDNHDDNDSEADSDSEGPSAPPATTGAVAVNVDGGGDPNAQGQQAGGQSMQGRPPPPGAQEARIFRGGWVIFLLTAVVIVVCCIIGCCIKRHCAKRRGRAEMPVEMAVVPVTAATGGAPTLVEGETTGASTKDYQSTGPQTYPEHLKITEGTNALAANNDDDEKAAENAAVVLAMPSAATPSNENDNESNGLIQSADVPDTTQTMIFDEP